MKISDIIGGLDKSTDTLFHLAWNLANRIDGLDHVLVLCRIAKACQASGDKEGASSLLESALKRAGALEGLDLLEGHVKIAESATECGNAEFARKSLSTVHQQITGIDDKLKQANMWVRISDCHFKLGEVMEAGNARAEALEIAQELKEHKIDILRDVSGACRKGGDRISISGLIDQVLDESRSISGENKFIYLLSLSEMYFDAARDVEARKCLEEAIILLDGLENNEILIIHLYSLALIYAGHQGGTDKCCELAERGMAIASGLEEGNSKDFALGMLSRIFLLAGNPDKALECANHVKGLARIKILLAISGYFAENERDSTHAIKLFIGSIGIFASLNDRERKRIRRLFPQMVEVCLDLKEAKLDEEQLAVLRDFAGQTSFGEAYLSQI